MKLSFIVQLPAELSLGEAPLASLRATVPPGLDYEVLLIADAAFPGKDPLRPDPGPPFVHLRAERHLGYASAHNRAAQAARGDILVLLDPHLTLPSGWLAPLLAAFAAVPHCGLVGNIQLRASSQQVEHAGIVFRPDGHPVPHRPDLASLRTSGDFSVVPAVSTACCLVRREWFLHAGGFSEEYGAAFAGIDLCLRAREDGLVNLVCVSSVVHCPMSQPAAGDLPALGDASRFLARWQPRTAAIAREWEQAQALPLAAADARRFLASWPSRLRLNSAAVRRQHQQALQRYQAKANLSARPVSVGVDLIPLQPGGFNEDLKPLILSFLAAIGRQRGPEFGFMVFAPSELRAELAPLLRAGDRVASPAEGAYSVSRRDPPGEWQTDASPLSLEQLTAQAKLDVLYAPFGDSVFMRADLPCVSLVVDTLHRDLPAGMPPEEIQRREAVFRRIVAETSYIQCLSRHVIARLAQHFAVHPTRCFHTYIEVRERLSPSPGPPSAVASSPFFLYPADSWPHKNHETLLLAYRLYAVGAGPQAWPLVLTGHLDTRMQLLREMSHGLGLSSLVHFPGHLENQDVARLWSQAGALVSASLQEGFGLPLVAAMHYGVPIVASDIPVFREIAGDAFLPVDSRDPQAFAAALQTIAGREDLRQDLVRRGQRRLSAFSLEHEARRLAHFLAAAARQQVP